MNSPSIAHPGRVLVVDDEPANVALFSAAMEHDGQEVATASNGVEALREIAACLPDVVLLDVRMPEMDGYEVCRRVRANPATAPVPIIMLTARQEKSACLQGIEAGANDFLTKPVNLHELRLRVRNAIYTKRLYDEVHAGYLRLKELEKLREDLTSMIVHDMRSSLMGVSGFLELLKLQAWSNLGKEEQAFLTRAVECTSAAFGMVDTLLDVSRLEAGQMPLSRATHDLVGIAEEALKSLGQPREGGRVHLEAPGPVLAFCDEHLIRRVIANLVGNALKFSPEDRPVELIVEARGETPVARVVDFGPGIAPEHHQRIFEKFGQVDPSSQRARSSGLGLAFCRLAVEAHGGAVRLSSAVGKGCEFRVELPPPGPEERRKAAEAAEAPRLAAVGGRADGG